jgi:Quinohemoprotein amine dehydrogenase A, alpha subunit, haem binding
MKPLFRGAWVFAAAMLCALPVSAQRKPARPQIVRPDGPVWEVIRNKCIDCHGIDDYAYSALDKEGWKKLIETKHRDYNVKLSEPDRDLLVDWLVSKFGPQTKPFPRAYVPQEITDFFSDPEANRLIDRACTKCHARDRIDKNRNTGERWRAITLDMRERGANIDDKEVEQLVEWLARVRGTNQEN